MLKKRYSGTIILSKNPAKQIILGFNDNDIEGIIITAVFDNFAIVNCHVPNGANRLPFKLNFMNQLADVLIELNKEFKKVLLSGETYGRNSNSICT